MTRLFNLDFQLLFDSGLLAISVFVLFLLMSKLLFNPARKLLTDRQNKIREDLASAAGDKEDAEKLRIEYEEKLKNAEKETEAILSEARQKALKNEAKIIADAKEEAAAIIARANEEAALEKKGVADEMKQEMISVAAMMAGKVVAANINTEIQADLVDDTLKEMGEATWQN